MNTQMNITEVLTTKDLPKRTLYRMADDEAAARYYADKHASPAIYYVLTNHIYYVVLELERENV